MGEALAVTTRRAARLFWMKGLDGRPVGRPSSPFIQNPVRSATGAEQSNCIVLLRNSCATTLENTTMRWNYSIIIAYDAYMYVDDFQPATTHLMYGEQDPQEILRGDCHEYISTRPDRHAHYHGDSGHWTARIWPARSI